MSDIDVLRKIEIELRDKIGRLESENARLSDDRRERIATAAMQGICANNTLVNQSEGQIIGLSKFSVDIADALIAELDKRKGKNE